MLSHVETKGQGTGDKVLLIDTCGEGAGLALAENGRIRARRDLPDRSASAALLSTLRELLVEAGWSRLDLTAIGVVSGPGSFTGVRVGMSAAKGLCEALGIPLAAVSRLAVLASASALPSGTALLNAGRGELYFRRWTESGVVAEGLCTPSDLAPHESLHESPSEAPSEAPHLVVAEATVAERLAALTPHWQPLGPADALPHVLQRLARGTDDVLSAEPNYGRGEHDIYRQKPTLGTSS